MKRRTLLSLGIGSAAVLGTAWTQRNPMTRWLLTRQSHPDVVLTNHSGLSQSCLLTPEQVQGPFFIPAPVRSDVREDRRGVNLELTLDVVSTTGCTPIQNALVEIWHCDAAGIYSAYPEDLARKPFETMMFLGGPDAQVAPTNEKRFLRSAQVTNANGQVVISGSKAGVDRACELAKEAGAKRAMPLAVSAPFHSALMAPAAEEMAAALQDVTISAPVVPVVANVRAEAVSDPELIRTLLVEQITGRVRWLESVVYMKEQGIEELVECGSGKVLTGLTKWIDKSIKGQTINSVDAVRALVEAGL